MIPNKNLFLVTSAIKCKNVTFFSHQQRFEQTLLTLDLIRQKVPDAIIVLSDVSVEDLTQQETELLLSKTNYFMDHSKVQVIREFSNNDMKSLAENALCFNSLLMLKQQPFMADVKRIFKISGRSILEDGFNINEYDNLFGKYVFKKRVPTWMNPVSGGATHLLITRMFSLCTSLVDNYMEVCIKNSISSQQMDTEHAHFLNIPKEHLVEFDKLHVYGWLAGNGNIESY